MATVRWIFLLFFCVSTAAWWRGYAADEAAVRTLIMGCLLGLLYLPFWAFDRRRRRNRALRPGSR